MSRRACRRILVGHFQRVLFDLSIFTNMVHVPIVKIVDVVAMLDAGVFTIRTVLMFVVGVKGSHEVVP